MSGLLLAGAGPSGADGPSFPAGISPRAWYKADAISGADGDPVTTWTDSSGNGNNITQATSTARPLLKTAVLNGRAVVRFDGLGAAPAGDFLAGTFTNSQPAEWFVVAKWANAFVLTDVATDGVGGAFNELQRNSSTGVRIYGGAFLTRTTTPQAWHQYTCVFNGASSSFAVDGGTAATGSAGTENAGGVSIGTQSGAGGTGGAAMDVAEVVICAGTLSGADRTAIESYLRLKWNLP